MLWFRLVWLKLKAESDSPERSGAIQKLADSGDDRAMATLVKVALTDEVGQNRETAIGGLKNIGDPKAGKLVARALRHESLRDNAFAALAELQNWAGEPLIEMLNDDDPGVRKAAVKALVELGPRVAKLLGPVLQGTSDVARQAAADALRQLEGESQASVRTEAE